RGRRGGPRTLLRRCAEERALALGEQLLEKFELEFRGGAGIAAQTGEFSGQGLELGVEFVVFALEEDRDLTKHLRIADRIEPEHRSTPSSCRARGKIFLRRHDHKRRGREGDAPDERAAFEEELQFAHGQAHDAPVGLAPQAREAAALEPLGVDAEPGAVPQEHLGPLAGRVHKQVAVPGERVVPETLAHDAAEPVEAFAQIDGIAVGPDRDLPRRADHPSACSTPMSMSRSRPSTRTPFGVTSTARPTASRSGVGAGVTATGRSTGTAAGWSHFVTGGSDTPSSGARRVTDPPWRTRLRARPTVPR